MALGQGYRSRAAFRLIGMYPGATAWPWPTALGTPTPDTLGNYDLIPFRSEQLKEEQEQQIRQLLTGSSGYAESNIVGKLSSGSMTLEGQYLGLDAIIASALGWEKVRSASALESPAFVNPSISGSATAAASGQLDDTTLNGFTAEMIGEWVRLEKTGANADIYSQVRRITGRPYTYRILVSPNWTSIPAAGTPYSIGSGFRHTFEVSRNMHSEPVGDVQSSVWRSDAQVVRCGVLAVDKSVCVWEFQFSQVNSLKLNYDAREGLILEVEYVCFGLDMRTSGRNSSSSSWMFSPLTTVVSASTPYAVTRRIRFADCTFWLKTQAASDETDSDKIGINSLSLALQNNLKSDARTMQSGLYIAEPAREQFREITGNITLPRHKATTLLDWARAGTMLMGKLHAQSSQAMFRGGYPALTLFMRGLVLNKPGIQASGPGLLEEKFDFRCLQPTGAVGATWPNPTTGLENGEIIIQTVNNNPFNYFMGQHSWT